MYNSRYTALTALGIRQEVEHIMANVFYLTFLNVYFILATFFTFFDVFFLFFLERFFHLCPGEIETRLSWRGWLVCFFGLVI